MLDYEQAKRTFRYEPETGKLFWAESRPMEDMGDKVCWERSNRQAHRRLHRRQDLMRWKVLGAQVDLAAYAISPQQRGTNRA